MLRPAFITFTGADDRTPISDMAALAADHDVEFAILLSTKRLGTPRYPSLDWIREVRGSGLRLAVHLCGAIAENVANYGSCALGSELAGFSRVQVNLAQAPDPAVIHDFARRLEDLHGHAVEPILQCRGDFPEDSRVSWLYDRSGGTGLAPASWPAPPRDPGVRFGYAGGLGPETVGAALEAMPAAPGAWIDMETRVRNAEDRFDLGLCRRVCEIAAALPEETPRP
ncbi:hypothetical protein LAZ40_09160 [Cereibacter sphaeroides]|uniref:hypothetical protein n=1 Tax=Cereibacter sphaeroides TaxID=1063 RepID=UPI001F2C8332|nr:hypothetical protein [Cereibacter sphaeroides]MCE6959219.1 hypothetical protein [Cereibacter sphaeroides]MCE6972022.1 hypothetical protein [Cereibacter sphaeroides]